MLDKPSPVMCEHANECPQVCPCAAACYCKLTISDGGSGMCYPAAVATREAARAAKEEDPNGHMFACMEDAMSDFSYVKWAEEKEQPKIDLNFGELDEKQSLMARRFMDLHGSIHGRYSGAIGGRYTWHITMTSIGTIAVIACSCGEKLDVSDYTSW